MHYILCVFYLLKKENRKTMKKTFFLVVENFLLESKIIVNSKRNKKVRFYQIIKLYINCIELYFNIYELFLFWQRF